MISAETAQNNLKRLGRSRGISGLVFLVPVITLLYKYSGLTTAQIVLLANITTFVFTIFELPTSTLADTMGRKRSLLWSATANIGSTALILVFPTFWSYVLASVCFGFYWCFWSGTAQAFLDENLRALGREKEFGRTMGHYYALERAAGIVAPLATAGILKRMGDAGYVWLAGLDFLFAVVLYLFLRNLKETIFSTGFDGIRHFFQQQLTTARHAIKNVRNNPTLRMYTVYRSLSNHVSYFMLLAFIMMTDVGMPDRGSGVLIIFASLMSLLASKYAYLVGDKKGRGRTWVFASSMQGILLICIGFLTQQWIRLVLIYLFFELFEGLRMPAWNHCIVQETKGVAIATTRSLIFAVFGLWTTVGKQFLSFFPIAYAMIGIGIFILLVNLYFARKIVNASSTFD